MSARPYNLAIETSARLGSVTLGRDDQLIATIQLPPQQRHTVDLVPAINQLFSEHNAQPNELGEIYTSVGPGSFTGLRIGVTTAKVLAHALHCRVVAVPTLHAVAQNVRSPVPLPDRTDQSAHHLAVCLNLKRETVYAGIFAWQQNRWEPHSQPALYTMPQLIEHAPHPLAILGDPLPPMIQNDHGQDARDIVNLPPQLAIPTSHAVWNLGRSLAMADLFTDPMSLLPLYVREPEAVELWNRRLESAASTR